MTPPHWHASRDLIYKDGVCVAVSLNDGAEIARACNSHAGLVAALEAAVSAAEYSIGLLEANVKAGDSPNSREKADWIGSCAHVYAAMSFVTEARAALAAAKGTV